MDQKRGQREFLTSANSRIIQCEHHLVAVLFVCEKLLLFRYGSTVSRRRYYFYEVFAVLFRHTHGGAVRSIFGAVGGLRYGKYSVEKASK